MSRKKFADLTSVERREWAAKVRALRVAMNMTQQQLADAAGVSRQSVNSLEGGVTTPQADPLSRVLAVLGVDLDPEGFAPQTDQWLQIIGTLIETIPEHRRTPAVNEAIIVLGRAIPEPRSNVTPIGVGPDQDTDDFQEEQFAADLNQKSPNEDLRQP